MTSVDPARTTAAEPIPADDAGVGVSRRTLVKAAAWTVPVIAIAAPVPAYAASPMTTINGITAKFKAWFTKDRNNRYIDLIGKDPQHPAEGFFALTEGAVGQSITGVSVFALIDKDIPDSAWGPRNDVGDVHWKKPVKVSGPDGAGFYTYRIDYRVAVIDVSEAGTVLIDARFHFRAQIQGNRVKVKGAWRAVIDPSATPVLDAASTNTASLSSDGDWTYVTSPGA